MIKSSSFILNLKRAVVGGNAAAEGIANGLMRAAESNQLQVAADGIRTRYPNGLHFCVRYERSV